LEEENATPEKKKTPRKTKPATSSPQTPGEGIERTDEENERILVLLGKAGMKKPPPPEEHRTRSRVKKEGGRSEAWGLKVSSQRRPSWPNSAQISKAQSVEFIDKLGNGMQGANKKGVTFMRKLARCINNPNACSKYTARGVRMQQMDWISFAHLTWEFPEHFGARGLLPTSFLNDIKEDEWDFFFGVPWLFVRAFSISDNLVEEEEEHDQLLAEVGEKRATFPPKVTTISRKRKSKATAGVQALDSSEPETPTKKGSGKKPVARRAPPKHRTTTKDDSEGGSKDGDEDSGKKIPKLAAMGKKPVARRAPPKHRTTTKNDSEGGTKDGSMWVWKPVPGSKVPPKLPTTFSTPEVSSARLGQ
jgi:hypothetical protein